MGQKTFSDRWKSFLSNWWLAYFLTQSFDCCSGLASSESIFLFLKGFFRGESCIWSPCFLFIVIQIRIFRWNYSLNNFRLLRFVDIGLFIGGKYGAKYFSHETATSSSISRIYIFSWDKFFNNFHLVHQHFFSLEHFFLFFCQTFIRLNSISLSLFWALNLLPSSGVNCFQMFGYFWCFFQYYECRLPWISFPCATSVANNN